MTVAPRPRRRSRPTLLARLRRFWLLGVVLAALVAGGGYALASAPAFDLHDLTITGLTHVSRAEVIARANIDPRANVWLLDSHAIAARIEAIPYVGTARVHRRPLASVWIEIDERIPEGCVRSRGGAALTVDRADRVLQRSCVAAAARTYELRAPTDVAAGRFARDAELSSLQRDADALTGTGADDRFRALRHDAYGGLEADLPSGVRVRFGDDRDLERKRKLIGPILAELGGRVGELRAVDLRSPSTPVVEFVPPRPAASIEPEQSLGRAHYTQGTHRVHHNM